MLTVLSTAAAAAAAADDGDDDDDDVNRLHGRATQDTSPRGLQPCGRGLWS